MPKLVIESLGLRIGTKYVYKLFRDDEKSHGTLKEVGKENTYLTFTKYKQGYFVTKSKRLDPSNRLLKWKLLFPEERRIPFLMTYFNIDPKQKKNNHPNGIKKIKSISYGTNAGFIPIVNELCDDNILNLFIGDGVSNIEYEK